MVTCNLCLRWLLPLETSRIILLHFSKEDESDIEFMQLFESIAHTGRLQR